MPGESIEKLTEAFKSHRERFERFCRSLSDAELARPVPNSHWRVKDFITHLATLDIVMTQQIEALAAGRNERLGGDGAAFDVDAWNETEIQARRDWPLDRILAEGAQNRAGFLDALAKLTEEQIGQTMHFTGDNKRDPADLPYKVFLWGLARHDPIHVADMMKALPERGGDAEVKAWLDDSVVTWYQTTMAGPPKR
jgi:hypothetical protein